MNQNIVACITDTLCKNICKGVDGLLWSLESCYYLALFNRKITVMYSPVPRTRLIQWVISVCNTEIKAAVHIWYLSKLLTMDAGIHLNSLALATIKLRTLQLQEEVACCSNYSKLGLCIWQGTKLEFQLYHLQGMCPWARYLYSSTSKYPHLWNVMNNRV